jgi:hypothetical protein
MLQSGRRRTSNRARNSATDPFEVRCCAGECDFSSDGLCESWFIPGTFTYVISQPIRRHAIGLLLTVAAAFSVAMAQPQFASAAQSRSKVKIGTAQQVTRPESAEERLGQEALSHLKFDWRETFPGWRVVFLPARRGYLGMTYRPERRIEIYVRLDRPSKAIAHDVAHELGHAMDVTYLDAARRGRFLELRDLASDTAWWACNSCTDLDTGAGDFAETFALWAAPRYKFYSTLAPASDPTTLATMWTEVFPEAKPLVTSSQAVPSDVTQVVATAVPSVVPVAVS